MSDNPHPLPDQPAAGWRDRLFGWRAVAATTLASVILGSAGGMARAAAADGADSQRGGFPGRGQFRDGQFPGGQFPGGQTGGQTGGQLGQQGQAPTGQPPATPQGQLPPGATGQPSSTLPRSNDEEA